MSKYARLNSLSRRQRISTYVVINTLSLLGGVEYAVILPTLYLHLKDTYNAKAIYLGLTLSAFSFSGLFASPLAGRFYDKTRRSKLIILVMNLFECIGSLMYWMGFSPLFLVVSRLVAGVGNGYFPVVLAEISHGTTDKERTSVVSGFMAMRQFGLLLGPGFNLFLSKTNFYIGPFIVDQYSSPGIFMALLWLAAEFLVIFFYSPLTELSKIDNNDNIADAARQVTQANGQSTQVNGQSTQVNGQSTQVNDHATTSIQTTPDGVAANRKVVVNELNTSSAEANQEVGVLENPSMKQVLKAFLYDKYMAIFMLTFVALFNQTGLETLFTPLYNEYLGWTEMQISALYCGAGGLVIVGFFLVHLASKRFKDRTLIVFGLLCQIVATGWNIYWIPTMTPNTPADYGKNALILMPALVVAIIGLPFIFVCHVSLLSKLLPADIQGVGQGMRRGVAGIASILGPLWAGSLLDDYYLLFGVMLGLNILALVLIALSFKWLFVPVISPPEEEIGEEEVNEQTRLINS